MLYTQDVHSGGAMMPVCIDCVCNYCTVRCSACKGDTETGLCCRSMCTDTGVGA